MPIPISRALGVGHDELQQTGAYDGFIDVDSRLYVDPHLLAAAPEAELGTARQQFERHFGEVIRILRQSKRPRDVFWNEAERRLTFHEIPHTGLGYSKGHTGGTAIGTGLAASMVELAKDIVDAGIEDPAIFELVGLLQEGVGADRVSDMTVAVILPSLLEFSDRIVRQLHAPSRTVAYHGREYRLPAVALTDRLLVLVPRSILRHLPTASDWSDVDLVASHNAALRARVNPIIGSTWKKATGARIRKADLRRTLFQHPELILDLVRQYAAKPARAYDFERDPAAQQLWYHLSTEVARADPLDLAHFQPVTPENVVRVVHAICEHFRRLIEDARLSRLLYNDDGSPRRERVAQLSFYAFADAYCAANNLDISPEADAGAGPVDFKFSRGYRSRVTVEVKLSSNPKLVHGFTRQLPAYSRAEQTTHSIFLVIRNTDDDRRVRAVRTLEREGRVRGERVPEVLVVDGRLRPAASRL
jgi:hypothetical protein